MAIIMEGQSVALWSTGTAGDLLVLSGSQIPRQGQGADPSLNTSESIAFGGDEIHLGSISAVDETSWAGFMLPIMMTSDQLFDFHFRFWIIPEELRLANPLVNTDIPFIIWNTFPVQQTYQAITVTGSDVLSFDKTPAISTIRDAEYQTVNLQIGIGEPNIEAVIEFEFPLGSAFLYLFATVSETFNLIPDVPVQETWEFLTDVLTAYDGTEQRISLRRDPRRTIEFDVDIIDLEQRQEQYELIYKNMGLQAIIPAYQHATRITQTSFIGASRLYFDSTKTQMRVGESIAIINIKTQKAIVAAVTVIYTDGVTIGSSLGEDVDTGNYVYPCHAMVIQNGSGLTMNSITGKLSIKAEGYSQPALPRPGASVSIDTVDGLNVMKLRPLISADEQFGFRAEIMDFDVGLKTILRKADPHPTIAGNRQWLIKRYDNSEDEDYMREFIDQVRGGQKAWLMPTWFPDLTLASISTPDPLEGTVIINEVNYPSLFFPHPTWQYIMIQYDQLPPSYHKVVGASVRELDGLVDLSFSPPLADNPLVSDIKTISFMLKVRGSDRISRRHEHRETVYSWGITTTDHN